MHFRRVSSSIGPPLEFFQPALELGQCDAEHVDVISASRIRRGARLKQPAQFQDLQPDHRGGDFGPFYAAHDVFFVRSMAISSPMVPGYSPISFRSWAWF